MSNKLLLEAVLKPYNVSLTRRKELASAMNLPDNDQLDLMFMSAVLVSTGTNKNGATFLGSELIKAKDSISQKPLDIEHEEDKIIGHIASSIFMDFDGNVLDDEAMLNELLETSSNSSEYKLVVGKLDNLDIDIGIVCAVYRDRFPELSDEIEKGEWKVSMECYYKDFDLKIGKMIVNKLMATVDSSLIENYEEIKEELNDVLNETGVNKLGGSSVSRVLRDIRFSGVGIVKNPANDRSIVLEAAKVNLNTEDAEIKDAASSTVEPVIINKVSVLPKDGYAIGSDKLQTICFDRGIQLNDVLKKAASCCIESGGDPVNVFQTISVVRPVLDDKFSDKYTTISNTAIFTSNNLVVEDISNLKQDVEPSLDNLEDEINVEEVSTLDLEGVIKYLWECIENNNLEGSSVGTYLQKSGYGISNKKVLPLKSEKTVKSAIEFLKHSYASLNDLDRKDLFDNVYKYAIIYNIGTSEIEEAMATKLNISIDKEYSSEYAIPRLSLLPLGSREQVIAAMSRCLHIKVELTDREKEIMVVNIIKAANKFNVDTVSFKNRVSKIKVR